MGNMTGMIRANQVKNDYSEGEAHMRIVSIRSIEGMEMPAGRTTRVIVGKNGAIQGANFAQGYVEIHVGGEIPLHAHAMEETYTILSGTGEMTVAEETRRVKRGDLVLIDPDLPHGLKNVGETELQLMFVYSPATIADHWGQELSGEL